MSAPCKSRPVHRLTLLGVSVVVLAFGLSIGTATARTVAGDDEGQGEKASESGKVARHSNDEDEKKKDSKKKAGKAADVDLGDLEIDPDLQKQIDDLLESAPADTPVSPKKSPRAKGRRSSRMGTMQQPPASRKPRSRSKKPGAKVRGAAAKKSDDSGPSTSINIAPTDSDVAPEDRMYSFSIKDGTYAQLIEGVARQTGLGVIGEAPRDGKVTFVTEEELTFDELLARIRVLLFKYKPHEPYWLLVHLTHLEVIRVNDIYRVLPLNRMFSSIEQFRAAKLPGHELALVVYTPKAGSISSLNIIRDFMPDYVRIAPLEGRNAVSIFALVSDVEKYLELGKIFIPSDDDDPRTLEIVEVHYIPPSVALDKLRTLMDLDGGGGSRPARASGKGRRDANPLGGLREPEMSIVPDDDQGVLIVRAMQDKIREIRKLLPYVDVDTSEIYSPVVIEVKHADVEELVSTIDEVLQASPSDGSDAGSTAKVRKPRGRKKKGAGRSPTKLTSDGITLFGHPTRNAVIVMCSEEKLPRLRRLVEMFDVPGLVNTVRIELEHGDPSEIIASVTQLMSPPGKKGKAAGVQFQLVPDPAGDAIWYSGGERDLAKVGDIIAKLDTAGDPVSLHIVRLVNQKPSFVAEVLSQYDSSGGASGGSTAVKRKSGKKTPRRKSTSSSDKFKPEDDQGRLFVMCTNEEWEVYLPLIQELENQVNIAEFVFLSVKHEAPQVVVDKLTNLLDLDSSPKGKGSRSSSVRFEIVEDGFLVVNATESQLATFESLLAEFDREVEIVERIFEIRYADPEELTTAVETLVGEVDAPRTKRKGDKPRAARSRAASATTIPELTIVQFGNRLVVRTTPQRMERVAELIAEFDVREDARTVRVYDDFPPGADLEGIADMLSSLVVGGSTPKPGVRKGKKAAASEGPQFVPHPSQGKLIVVAEASMFDDIEEMLEVLRPQINLVDTVVGYIDVQFADPEEIIELISPLLQMKIRRLVAAGKLPGALLGEATPAKKPKARKPGQTPTGDRPFHLAADMRNKRLILAAPQMVVDEARRLVADFDKPRDKLQIEIAFVDVEFADPAELVETLDPLLTMKVEEFIRTGVLPDLGEGGPSASKKGKTRPSARKPRQGGDLYHLEPDERNSQILVAGPSPVVQEATRLIRQLDKPDEATEEVFRTLKLESADAGAMVKAIREMIGTGGPTRKAGKKGRKSKIPSATSRSSTTGALTIVEAPGGGAVVLRGPEVDVEQAIDWIQQLDAISVGGREFKVYQIEHADVSMLVDLIMNVVDTAGRTSGKPGAARSRGRAAALQPPPEDEEFPRTKVRIGADVYIQADLIMDSMIVAASPGKLAEIDEIVARFDTVEEAPTQHQIPSMMYELVNVEAFDAAYELEMVLEALWEPRDQLPQVDYAPFGEILIVRYPDKDRFPEIEELIAKYVDLPKPTVYKRKVISALPGINAEQTALLFKMNYPDLDIQIVDVSTPGEGEYERNRVRPRKSTRENKCVLPLGFQRAVNTLATVAVQQVDPEDPDDEEVEPLQIRRRGERRRPSEADAEESEGVEDDQTPADPLDASIQQKSIELLDRAGTSPAATKEEDEEPKRRRSPRPGQASKLTIIVDNETGSLVFKGASGIIAEVPDMLDELKEEMEKLNLPPDIRVYRVQYIDVYAAQEIVEEMFNATRQQRAQVQAMQRQQQQRLRQQQQQQQKRQAQQAKGQQSGQPGLQARPGPGQKTPQAAIPQLPAAAVRIYPNPRDRTLILRADTSQYPAILDLLATIDQPQPIESIHRIYQLKKLNAAEVEELLKDWLGLTAAPARRATQGARAGGKRAAPRVTRSASGGRLPRTIVQKSATGAGTLGIDPKDIKLSSNADANTILAMAPKVALDYIGELIEDLESYEGADRIWKSYILKYADVTELADYLISRLSGAAPGGAGGKAKRGAKSSPPSSRGSLTSATFVAYPRLNMLSAQGTKEELEEVDELIAELDVATGAEDFKSVTLAHADAKVVADTLSAMFVAGGAPSGRAAKRGKGAGVRGPKFIGEDGGRIVFYSAAAELHDKIRKVIGELEEQSKESTQLHIIELTHARPSVIADAIQGAYGESRRARGKGRGGAGGAARPRVTVTPNDATKRLFVVADERTFAEVESLVKALDKQMDMGFDFRIFPLQYADARRTHTTMTKLVTDYMKNLPRDARMEAFSVEVDDKANALIVLGSPVVFGFVEDALEKIDTPLNAASPPAFLMIPLKNADAQEVAQNITRLWSTKGQESVEPPPIAEANRSTNTVIVHGTQEQIDEIRREIIEPLEQQPALGLLAETISLKHARAQDVAEHILSIFEERRRARQESGGGRGQKSRPLDTSVAVTADINTNQLIVEASEENMAFLKGRVTALDRPDIVSLTATATKVYPVAHAELDAVVKMIKEWSKSKTQAGSGRQRQQRTTDTVVAIAEPGTKSVVVTTSEANHALIKEMLENLEAADTRRVQVKNFPLTHADPGSVQDAINKLFQGTGRTALDKVTAVPEWKSNSVLVSASPDNLERVEQLIADVDREGANPQGVHVVNLANADAKSVAQTLNEIFVRSAPRAQGGQAPPISVSALEGSKAVLIRCKPEDFKEIETVVAELDREGTVMGEEIRVISLLYGDATEMQAAMEKYLEKSGGVGRGGGELVGDTRISVLLQMNALVVSGKKEKVERLEKLIRQLDAEGEKSGVPQIIPLEFAKAAQILPSLKEMFTEQRGTKKGQSPPVIVADEVGNVLIVRGSSTDLIAIESIVQKLDTSEAAERPNFRLVQVGQGVNVTDLADKVEHSINEGARRQPGLRGGDRDVPSITVTPDARTGTLVVAGSHSLFDDAEKLAMALEKMGPSGGRTTRVIKTKNVRVDDIQRLIDQLTDQASSGRRSKGSAATSKAGKRRSGSRSRRSPGR